VPLVPVPPMMATIASELPIGAQWSYEVKWDGYRAELINDGTRTRLISRNLKNLTDDYPQIPAALHTVTKELVLLDGEIVALDEHGRPSFQALQHRSLKRSAVVYYAFDLLHLDGTDYRTKRLAERRRALQSLNFAAPILLSAPLPGTPREIERVARGAGLEGIVAKRIDSLYEPGIRTRNWLKVKFNRRQEFVIGGYKPAGDTFDSVLVGYFDSRRFVCAGKVRAGFRPQTRREVFHRLVDAGIERCPFVNLPNSTGKTHWGEGITAEEMTTLRWVTPTLVIEVAFVEWTAGGNLRHASFAGVRDDKSPRDVQRKG
jgi:bifunctional non-homologous end joining protein LigD